jgi:hypothetical protein
MPTTMITKRERRRKGCGRVGKREDGGMRNREMGR